MKALFICLSALQIFILMSCAKQNPGPNLTQQTGGVPVEDGLVHPSPQEDIPQIDPTTGQIKTPMILYPGS